MRHLSHPIERAKEHYGLTLTTRDLRDIATKCERGNGHYVASRDGHQIWRVLSHGKSVLAVYDADQRRVITLLHPQVILRANGSVDVRASIANGTPDNRSVVMEVLRRGAR